MYASPLQAMVTDAEGILRELGDAGRNLELAIERKSVAVRKLNEAEQNYEEMQSEFQVEMLYREQPQPTVKLLAADKELIRDAELIKARNTGLLAPYWQRLNLARNEAANASMAFDQMEVRFRAIRLASELRSSILLTFAKG